MTIFNKDINFNIQASFLKLQMCSSMAANIHGCYTEKCVPQLKQNRKSKVSKSEQRMPSKNI